MRKPQKNIRKILINFIVVLLFLSFLFVASSEDSSEARRGSIYVFYVDFNRTYILLILLILGVLLSLKRNTVDDVTCLLSIRAVLFCIFSALLLVAGEVNSEFRTGILLSYFICIFAYFFGKKIDKNFLAYVFSFCLIVILIQLIMTYVGRGLSFNNASTLKWWMRIPIGQTNTVGCFIVGMIMFICASNIPKFLKFVSLMVGLVGILFTVSRASLLIYILYIIFLSYKAFQKKGYSRVLFFGGMIVIGIVGVVVLSLTDIDFLDRFNWTSLTSNRFKVYNESLQIFLQHPLTGITGYKFHVFDTDKAHNWILESLLESGIIGSFFFFLSIYLSIKGIYKKNKQYMPFVVIYLLHGMVEPNLLTVGFDLFFWMIIGSLQIKNEPIYETL